jgi:hypothetical protein
VAAEAEAEAEESVGTHQLWYPFSPLPDRMRPPVGYVNSVFLSRQTSEGRAVTDRSQTPPRFQSPPQFQSPPPAEARRNQAWTSQAATVVP